MFDFLNKYFKVYLWCYFVDKVLDINMFSLILILIVFNIKFQCQYFYYNFIVLVVIKEYFRFVFVYLLKIFFGKIYIFLLFVYFIKQFIENFILGKRSK